MREGEREGGREGVSERGRERGREGGRILSYPIRVTIAANLLSLPGP